jgi:hypothetical protein
LSEQVSPEGSRALLSSSKLPPISDEALVAGPARVQLQNKDPRGFREFCQQFAEPSALGSANTLRGVQMKRPTIYSLKSKLCALKVP